MPTPKADIVGEYEVYDGTVMPPIARPTVCRPGLVRLEHGGPVAVIGDIHGRVDHLERLLDRLPRDVALVVAGDICDRGPSTREVIDLLIERGASGARGNHDEWLIAWASGRGFDRYALGMGAEATLTSYGSVGRDEAEVKAEYELVPRLHLAWLESLGTAIDLRVGDERYWVVHAGIPSSVSFAGLRAETVVPHLVSHHAHDLLWACNDPEAMPPVDRPVIMGHRVMREPLDLDHVIAIDTGCGVRRDGYLTAVLLPDRRFIDSR